MSTNSPEQIWLKPPGSAAEINAVFEMLFETISAADARTRFAVDDHYDAARRGDLDQMVKMAEVLVKIGRTDLGRSFMWIAASAGMDDAILLISTEIAAEAKQPKPVRNAAYLGHLLVCWMAPDAVSEDGGPESDGGPDDASFDSKGGLAAVTRPDDDLVQLSLEEAASEYVDEPADKQGVTLIRALGDAQSREGRDLLKRYGHIVGRPLPFAGSRDKPHKIAQDMVATFPWAEDVARFIQGQLSMIWTAGSTVYKLPPILLVGPTGCAKTSILDWLAKRLGIPSMVIPCGGSGDTANLTSTARHWSTSKPSAPVQMMAEHGCANPAVILDELDKGSTYSSNNGSVMGAALAMLDRADLYQDSCLMASVDLSHVSFFATANRIEMIPVELRERFRVMPVGRPREQDFGTILEGMRAKEAKRLGVDEAAMPFISQGDKDWLRQVFLDGGRGLRNLNRAYQLLIGERAREEMEMSLRPN